MMLADCGVAQIFDFTVDGEKIWFTEWVENNIGVVDTSMSITFEIQLIMNFFNNHTWKFKTIELCCISKSQKDLDVH